MPSPRLVGFRSPKIAAQLVELDEKSRFINLEGYTNALLSLGVFEPHGENGKVLTQLPQAFWPGLALRSLRIPENPNYVGRKERQHPISLNEILDSLVHHSLRYFPWYLVVFLSE